MFCGPAPPLLCCADEEGGRRHHDRQNLVRRHQIRRHYVWRHHVQQYNVWQRQSAPWFNATQRKAPQTILLNMQSCILADSHSQALYLAEVSQNEKKIHLKQDAINFPLFFYVTSWIFFPSIFLFSSFLGGKRTGIQIFSRHSAGIYCKLGRSGLKPDLLDLYQTRVKSFIYFPDSCQLPFLKNSLSNFNLNCHKTFFLIFIKRFFNCQLPFLKTLTSF